MFNKVKKIIKQIIRNRGKKKDKINVLSSSHQVMVYKVGKEFDYKKHGFSLYESVLFNLNKNDYHEYISTWEAYQPRYNLSEYHKISDDKYLFSIVFGKYIETPVSYGLINDGIIEPLSPELQKDCLYDFLIKKSGGVIKDRFGYNGYNIYVFKVIDNYLFYRDKQISKTDLDEIVLNFNRGLIQSIITQGAFENSIYNKSINTIRLITIKKEGTVEHEAVCAVQRIGSDRCAPVDNFSQGGYSSLINLETGELGPITSPMSKDAEMNQIFYDKHPDNGIQVKGKIIPNWQNIKQQVVDLTRKIPFYNYVAWDIVLKDDGIAVIEINMKSSLCVVQVHGGMRNTKMGEAYKRMHYLK